MKVVLFCFFLTISLNSFAFLDSVVKLTFREMEKSLKESETFIVTKFKNAAEKTEDIIKKTQPKNFLYPVNISTHTLGRFGDYITALRLTGMGYTKLKSKTSKIHGIDGVYIKREHNNEIYEIIIVENKVNSAQLAPKQMSKEWLDDRINKMILSDDIQVKKTGDLLKEQLVQNPEKIKKQLWHHGVETGTTKVHNVDIDGNKSKEAISEWSDKLIANTIEEWCKKGHFEECKLNIP